MLPSLLFLHNLYANSTILASCYQSLCRITSANILTEHNLSNNKNIYRWNYQGRHDKSLGSSRDIRGSSGTVNRGNFDTVPKGRSNCFLFFCFYMPKSNIFYYVFTYWKCTSIKINGFFTS